MVTAVERTMYFDVWAFDDPLGGAIGELTAAHDKQTRDVEDEPGAGSFRINRNHEEFEDLCATDNIVRVRLEAGGPFTYDDEGYIFAWIIEEGSDTIVSTDEEGGEYVDLHGRSAEVLLERAIVDFEAHYVDDIVNHPYDRTALRDGHWHFSEDIPNAFSNAGSPGAVLRILLRNAGAMVPEPIPEVSHDFSVNVDSNGDAWDDADGQFDFAVGTNLLTVLARLVDGGIHYRFGADLTLQAWDDPQGTDVTGSVTIEKGVNIREAGQRAIHASDAKSRVLVRGTTKGGTLKYRWVEDAGIETSIGVRQGYLDYPHSPTNTRLDKAGGVYLTERNTWHDGPPTVGIVDTAGATAYVDFVKGDTIDLDLPGIDDGDVRVHAVILMDNEAGNVDPVLEFVGPTWNGEPEPSSSPNTDSSTGYSSLGSGTDPVDLDPIDVAEGQVALIWSETTTLTLTQTTGTLLIRQAGNFAWITGEGTFTPSGAGTGSYHIIVLPLGQAEYATGA